MRGAPTSQTSKGFNFTPKMPKSYQQKLLDPRWQKRKAEILTRDNFTCQVPACSSANKTLHVHHLDYIPGIEPWEYPDDMLKTLCFECHQKERDRDRLEVHLSNTLKMKGFFISDLLNLACIIDTNEKFTKSLLKTLRQNG